MESMNNDSQYDERVVGITLRGEMNITYINDTAQTEIPPPQDLTIPVYMFVGVTLAYLIIFLMGVGGNVMVVWIVIRNRDMRSATNVFLLSLSIADLLVLIINENQWFVFARDDFESF